LSVLAGCVKNSQNTPSDNTPSQTNQTGSETKPENPYEKELKINAVRYYDVNYEIIDDLQNKLLKEKYNMTIEYEDYPPSEFETKLNLLFASGDGPDFMPLGRYGLTNWTNAGYLRPFTRQEIEEKIPNYIEYYGSDFEDLWKYLVQPDGNIYYLAWRGANRVNMGWLYRKETFDKLNLSFPKTTDEFYNVLKTIQTNYPDKVPLLFRKGHLGAIYQMFWIPELADGKDSAFVDPVTKEFVAYAYTSPNAREAIIFLNKLYKEKLLYQEFLTATSQQTDALAGQGHGFMDWIDAGYGERRNNLYKEAVPDVNWTVSKDMITAYPEKGWIYRREALHYEWGTVITKMATEEEAQRLIDYINWGLSDEGQMFHSFGVEGVTYTMVDGKPDFLPHMADRPDADPTTAKKLQNYGIFTNWFIAHPLRRGLYQEVDYKAELENEFVNNKEKYYFFRTPLMKYTDEENKQLADVITAVNDVKDEYIYKFIMGQLDPTNDKQWDNFMNAMKRAGLDEVVRIRTEVYERSNKK